MALRCAGQEEPYAQRRGANVFPRVASNSAPGTDAPESSGRAPSASGRSPPAPDIAAGKMTCCSVQCSGVFRRGEGNARDVAHGAETYVTGPFALPKSEYALADRLRAAGHLVPPPTHHRGRRTEFRRRLPVADHGLVIELDTPDRHNRRRAHPRDRALDALVSRVGLRLVRILDDGDDAAIWERVIAAL